MLARFWGTRGSLPAAVEAAAVRAKVREAVARAAGRDFASDAEIEAFVDGLPFSVRGTYGGNSACVEIETGGDEHVLCDLGSGLRGFGHRVMSRPDPGKMRVFDVFLSHVHWDHIMGFPFFVPAYVPGNTIRIHSCQDVEDVVRPAFVRQNAAPCFPVDFSRLGAAVEFVQMEPGRTYAVAGLEVRAIRQFHGGDSFGYRFEKDGKSLVYSTDCEHKVEGIGPDYPFVEFFRGADLVIYDAMYALADAMSVKEDWGHSSNVVGVELCQMAGAKRLVMFHHEPIHDDAALDRILAETRRYEEISRQGSPLEVIAAYDGLEIRV